MRFLGSATVFAVLAICFGSSAAHAAPTHCGLLVIDGAKTCTIDPAIDPAAVCNDGSTPAFWYRRGYGSGANEWLIWLGGGGDCDSGASCAVHVSKQGAFLLISSVGFQATPGKGITSSKKSESPALYNANTVYLHYCSSDTWAGDKPGTGTFNMNDSSTWAFEGRRVAVAQIKALTQLLPAFAAASQIIIGGDSSGGVGVTEVANDILPLLPPSASKLFVNDAGFTLNIGQYDTMILPPFVYPDHPNAFDADLQQRLSYWNARGDAVCDAAATTPDQHANCYNTAYILQNGFITIPSFVGIALLDTSQITLQLCPAEFGYCPFSREPLSPPGIYATEFGKQMATLVVGAGTAANYTSYAPDKYMHVILNDDNAFTTPRPFPQGQIAPRDVFDHWLANPTAVKATFIGNGPGVS